MDDKTSLDLDIRVINHYLFGCLSEIKRQSLKGTVEQGFSEGVSAGGYGIESLVSQPLSNSMKTALFGLLHYENIQFGLPLYCTPLPSLGEERVNFLSGYAKGFVDAAEITTGQSSETLIGYFHRAMMKLELQYS